MPERVNRSCGNDIITMRIPDPIGGEARVPMADSLKGVARRLVEAEKYNCREWLCVRC